jgi:WD repeat-containing protein 34
MSRVPAKFQDCDLFSVHFAPQPPKNEGFNEFGTQTSSIMASDSSTQTVTMVEGGTQTETNHNKGEEKDNETTISLDQITPFLSKTTFSMEKELISNSSSMALKNYPDQTSSMFGGLSHSETAEEFLTLQAPNCALGLECTSVGWNASGSLLLATYGRFDVSGWCSYGGVLAGWSVFRRDFVIKAPPEVSC